MHPSWNWAWTFYRGRYYLARSWDDGRLERTARLPASLRLSDVLSLSPYSDED